MPNRIIHIILFLLLSCFTLELIEPILSEQKTEQGTLDYEHEEGDEKQDKEEKKERTNGKDTGFFSAAIETDLYASSRRANMHLIDERALPTYHLNVFSPPPEV